MAVSETHFHHLFMEASTVLVCLSKEFIIQEWNKEATLKLGWQRGEMVKKNFIQTLIPSNQQEVFYRAATGLQVNGEKIDLALYLLHQSGYEMYSALSIKYIEAIGKNENIFLISGSNFKKQELYSSESEMIATSLVETQLYESRQMLHLVLDNIPQRVFWKDRQLNYLGCNRAAIEDLPMKHPKEIVGKSDYDLFNRQTAEGYRKDDQQVMETNTPKINYEEEKTRLDGSRYWLRTSKVPLHDMHGNVIGILGSYEDITKRKQIENTLYEQNRALHKLNAELDNFVYRASHDLRAPLMSVLGLTQLMKLTEEKEKQ